MNLPASMTTYETFPCPTCGQGVPATVPKGMQFPCPYCKAPVVSPGSSITAEQAAANVQWALQYGAAEAAAQDLAHRQQHDPGSAHFAPGASVLFAVAGDGRRLLLGAQVDPDRTWKIRAIELGSYAQVWEAMAGSTWSFPPDRSHMAVRAGRLYVAHQGQLAAIDLATGRYLWGTRLVDAVETDSDLMFNPDEVMIFDLCPGAASSVVVMCTEQGYVVGYDRDSGQCRWQQTFDDSAKITPLYGSGVAVRFGGGTTILGLDGSPIAQFSDSGTPAYEGGLAHNGTVLIPFDSDEGKGVAIVDGATGQVRASRIVQEVDDDPAPITVGNKFVAMTRRAKPGTYQIVDPGKPQAQPGFFAKLFGGKPGSVDLELGIPKMGIVAMRPCGPLVVMQLRGWEDLDERRVVAIDVNSGAKRYDSGQLPYRPSSMEPAQVQANDQMFVYVTAPGGDDNECELRGVDASGQQRWATPVGSWNHHFLSGDVVVCYAHGRVHVLDLASGERVGGYPAAN